MCAKRERIPISTKLLQSPSPNINDNESTDVKTKKPILKKISNYKASLDIENSLLSSKIQ